MIFALALLFSTKKWSIFSRPLLIESTITSCRASTFTMFYSYIFCLFSNRTAFSSFEMKSRQSTKFIFVINRQFSLSLSSIRSTSSSNEHDLLKRWVTTKRCWSLKKNSSALYEITQNFEISYHDADIICFYENKKTSYEFWRSQMCQLQLYIWLIEHESLWRI
jgi:hypothetical protein